MGAGKFTKTDSDLLGLLQGNRRRASRQIESAVKEEKKDRLSEIEQLRQQAVELRDELYALGNLKGAVDELTIVLNGNIEADEPGLASLVENIRLTVDALPHMIDEEFVYANQIKVTDEMTTFQTTIDSFIRRGYLNDPGSGDPIFGIAIGRNLSVTAEKQEVGGKDYYELEDGQTLGLYTSTGWQFYIEGKRVGWFDSEDEQLHVPQMFVEDLLNLGGGWSITAVGGFGIKYTG